MESSVLVLNDARRYDEMNPCLVPRLRKIREMIVR